MFDLHRNVTKDELFIVIYCHVYKVYPSGNRKRVPNIPQSVIEYDH